MARRQVGQTIFISKGGRGRRIVLWILLSLIVLFTALVILGLWGSNGWLPALLRGQRMPALSIPADAVVSRPDSRAVSARVSVDLSAPIHRVDPRYLSVAIDLSQVTGGDWWNPEADGVEPGTGTVAAPVFDFERERLEIMAAELAPAYVRVGGSESDKIYYDLNERGVESDLVPEGYESVLTGGQWDRLNRFAERIGLDVVFTLNAGPSARDSDGEWIMENAADLISYTAGRGYPVRVWELGNEVNNFWYVFGVGEQIKARQYHEDSEKLVSLLESLHPSARFGGQGAMIWPVLGEPLGLFFGMSIPALQRNGPLQDVVSWHYYPQQSRRGPVASRRAHPARLLNPKNLDEVAHWARRFHDARNEHQPDAELWVGETGNAQFGGEPGLSDVYLGGLWWLDQLGLLAREQHDVVVRQSLTGMNYGLIDERTLEPRPDYWNSVLWKRLMGSEVYDVELSPAEGSDQESVEKIRAYAHRTAGDRTRTTVLMINLHHDRAARLRVAAGNEPDHLELYQMTARDVYGTELLVNGVPFRLDATGTVQEWVITPVRVDGNEVELPPLSYAFAVVRASR